jgi:prepilin-type N-terminal cleavage/methylation domain-containing protein
MAALPAQTATLTVSYRLQPPPVAPASKHLANYMPRFARRQDFHAADAALKLDGLRLPVDNGLHSPISAQESPMVPRTTAAAVTAWCPLPTQSRSLSRGWRRGGFTLVELLVVITIIVVLLALLTPALDRAIYQAELAVCGANLKALATASHTYAVAGARSYPRTHPIRGTARMIRQGMDMRPLIRPYASVNGMFNDPFIQSVNYDTTAGEEVWIWSARNWYAGWGIIGQKPMFKVGDRLTWTNVDYQNVTRNYTSRVLAGDRLRWWESETSWSTSHPDSDGLLVEVALDESGSRAEWEAGGSVQATALRAGSGVNPNPVVLSEWVNVSPQRGLLDLNFALDDGSVVRFTEVKMHDPRLARVPHGRGGNPTNDLTDRIPAD